MKCMQVKEGRRDDGNQDSGMGHDMRKDRGMVLLAGRLGEERDRKRGMRVGTSDLFSDFQGYISTNHSVRVRRHMKL